jgi:hypothetical protein
VETKTVAENLSFRIRADTRSLRTSLFVSDCARQRARSTRHTQRRSGSSFPWQSLALELIPSVCVLVLQDLTKLFAWGGEESGGHVLRETTSRGLCGTREEPGTLTQGAPVFPGSSRLGIEPKTPGWLVQDPTTRPIGDLIPTIGGSGAHSWRGWDP